MGSRTETRANQSATVAAGQRPTGTPAQEPVQKAQFRPQEESAARIAADFDLRRAVIYSEILKPKFEEE